MTAYDRLDLLFQQNNGIVKTAQVLEIGIAKIACRICLYRPATFLPCHHQAG